LESLSAQIFLAEGGNLQQLASITIVSNQNVVSGNTFTKDIRVMVPPDSPRTTLFAEFTEIVDIHYVNAYSYNYYEYPYDYDCSYYTYASYDNMQYYCYYPYNSHNANPTYSYYSTADTGISPLSYINATTPEYTALLSQYQSAQQQINQLGQLNGQLQTQNQLLQQNLKSAQGSISQQNSNNNNLTAQLTAANSAKQELTYLAAGLGIIVIALGTIASRKGHTRKTQSVNPYAANYEPPKQTHGPEASA